jgi:hypothetical protein
MARLFAAKRTAIIRGKSVVQPLPGADDQEEVAAGHVLVEGGVECSWQLLAEEHYVWFDQPAAFATHRHAGMRAAKKCFRLGAVATVNTGSRVEGAMTSDHLVLGKPG